MKFNILILLEILWLSPLSTQGRECVGDELNCPEDQCIARSFVCDGDPDCIETEADEAPELCKIWDYNKSDIDSGDFDSWWRRDSEEEEPNTEDNTVETDNGTEETIVTTITPDCVSATECCSYGARTRDFFECCNKYNCYPTCAGSGLHVPEPIIIRDKFSEAGINFWDLAISGISGGKLDYLKVNLTSLKAVVRITVPYINITGQYQWPGYWCTSEGGFNITLEGFSTEAELDIPGGILRYSKIEIDMEYADNGLYLDFEGTCGLHSELVRMTDGFFGSVIKPLFMKLITGQTWVYDEADVDSEVDSRWGSNTEEEEHELQWIRMDHFVALEEPSPEPALTSTPTPAPTTTECKTRDTCTDAGGVCKIKCDDEEEELKERRVCKGKRCKCCVTKPSPEPALTSTPTPAPTTTERVLEDGLTQLLLVTELIKYYQHEDPKGKPGTRVPEPMIIREGLSEGGIGLWVEEIAGISGGKLDYLKVNLTSLKAVVRITVPYINITGQYVWAGYWCTSEGGFNITLEGFSTEAELDIPGGILRYSKIEIDMEYADNGLHYDFEGLCSITHRSMMGATEFFFGILMKPILMKLITGPIWKRLRSLTLEQRRAYETECVNHSESMDDNGMVSISVPVEHVKMVEHYVDSLVALDYVARNHDDILPSYREDN